MGREAEVCTEGRVGRKGPCRATEHAATALRQKVGALAGRPQTQPRDVFDLHHLLTIGTGADALGVLGARVLAGAGANARSVDFGMFKSQVLAYLSPEDQEGFDSSSVWDSMVLEVVVALGRKLS